jgi:hypothetical protein
MKKLCKNCGAKIPKKADTCKKCGEPYEYIDLELDQETKKALAVRKPSYVINVCVILLAVLVFAYSLLLIYFKFTGGKDDKKQSFVSDSSVTDITDSSTPEDDISSQVHYNAIDFIGQTFGEVKKVLGEQYSLKVSDTTTLVSYINFPVTLSTADQNPTDESVITKVIVTGNAHITPVASCDMTYDELKIVLAFTKPAPELNQSDAFYYVSKVFENDNCQMHADFKFDNDSTDKAPLEVIIYSADTAQSKVIGIVSGLDEGSSLNVRSDAYYDAEALTQIYEGDEVEIINEINSGDVDWYEIITKDNIKGFSVAEFIEKKSDTDNQAAVTTTADAN